MSILSGQVQVQLAPGTYYVAIRNSTNGSNGYSYELDYEISDVLTNPDQGSRFTFSDHYVNTSTYVAKNNGWYLQPFSIQAGFRYFLDGVNSGGLSCFIIPASEMQNFRNGGVFQQFPTYKEEGGFCPGLMEIKLPPGDYAVAIRNSTGTNRAVVITMDRWRIVP